MSVRMNVVVAIVFKESLFSVKPLEIYCCSLHCLTFAVPEIVVTD